MQQADASLSPIEDLRILVVDDEEAEITQLRDVLASSGFANVDGTTDVDDAESRWTSDPPDLVLLGLGAEPRGLAALERLRPRMRANGCLPVVVLTASPSLREQALEAGARDFAGKPLDRGEVLARVRNQLELRVLRRSRKALDRTSADRVRTGMIELEAARIEVVERLARAGEFRDDETGDHTRRVGATARQLALAAGVDARTAQAIGVAAPLHDIGKIAIPDAILLRRGRLSADEVRVMQRHTTIGARILDGSSSTLLNLARDIALSHHERWDGGGYPSGVAGRDIPLAGRIVSLADVFDALTHERPYKEAWPVSAAVDEISSQSGGQFEPTLVSAFLTIDHATLI